VVKGRVRPSGQDTTNRREDWLGDAMQKRNDGRKRAVVANREERQNRTSEDDENVELNELSEKHDVVSYLVAATWL
jgi:hypothetical protein